MPECVQGQITLTAATLHFYTSRPPKSMWNLFVTFNKGRSANQPYGDAYMTPFRFPLLQNNGKIWPAKLDVAQRKHTQTSVFVSKPRS